MHRNSTGAWGSLMGFFTESDVGQPGYTALRNLAALLVDTAFVQRVKKLVYSQFKTLDGDAVRSDTAHRKSVLEVGPMGFTGDAFLLPFRHVE